MVLYIRNPKVSTRKLLKTIKNLAMWQDMKSICTNQELFIHQQQTHRKADYEHSPIYSILKENTVSRNKPNQCSERLL